MLEVNLQELADSIDSLDFSCASLPSISLLAQHETESYASFGSQRQFEHIVEKRAIHLPAMLTMVITFHPELLYCFTATPSVWI